MPRADQNGQIQGRLDQDALVLRPRSRSQLDETLSPHLGSLFDGCDSGGTEAFGN